MAKATTKLTAQERVILFCTATGISHVAVGITAHAMQSMAVKGFIAHDHETGAYALTDSYSVSRCYLDVASCSHDARSGAAPCCARRGVLYRRARGALPRSRPVLVRSFSLRLRVRLAGAQRRIRLRERGATRLQLPSRSAPSSLFASAADRGLLRVVGKTCSD
jgi:hypothetical protein